MARGTDNNETPVELAEAKAPQAATPTYEVVGLTPREDKTLPILVGGQQIDLAQADQTTLKALYDAGKSFVRIANK